MDPLHATIKEFAAAGYTHVECFCPDAAISGSQAQADRHPGIIKTMKKEAPATGAQPGLPVPCGGTCDGEGSPIVAFIYGFAPLQQPRPIHATVIPSSIKT